MAQAVLLPLPQLAVEWALASRSWPTRQLGYAAPTRGDFGLTLQYLSGANLYFFGADLPGIAQRHQVSKFVQQGLLFGCHIALLALGDDVVISGGAEASPPQPRARSRQPCVIDQITEGEGM